MNEPTANAKTTEQASSLSSVLSDLTNTKLNLIGAASSLTQLRLAATPAAKPAPSTPAPSTQPRAAVSKVQSAVSSALSRLRVAKTSAATTTTAAAAATTAQTDTTRYQALSQTLTRAQGAIKNAPQPSSETFVIQGQFVNENGQPRPDCSLVATDAGDVLSSKLHPQRANADGYATLVLRALEFPTVVDGTVPIFVSVIDSTGSQVYAPASPITAKGGTVALFRAVIPGTASC
jgi:hypothetical protein